MSMLVRSLWIASVLASGGCGKEAAPDAFAEPSAAAAYDPAPAEVPLAVDFEQAARRRVKADNYREELARIERELKLAARLR